VLKARARRRTPRLDIAWRPNQQDHPRLGVVVPLFGRSAVARNRLRRRLREFARRQILPVLPAIDLVIKSRASAYSAGSNDLAADLEGWLDSLPR
jgi:ribonuclease P protein component